MVALGGDNPRPYNTIGQSMEQRNIIQCCAVLFNRIPGLKPGPAVPEYAKIHFMKARLPHPEHSSYLAYRKQVVWQVIMPVVLAALLLVGLIVLISVSTFRGGGEVGRWAAISTIWIIFPVLVAGLVILMLLIAFIYLVGRLLHITPTYTGLAQDYVFRVSAVIKRLTKAVIKPVFFFDNLAANIKGFIGRR